MYNYNKNNKKTKFAVGLLSGMAIGLLGGVLLNNQRREKLRDIILYRFRKLSDFSIFLFKRITTESKPENPAKETSKQIVTNTKNKASKLLKDINKLTLMFIQGTF